jgi:hypothetical protein
LGPTTAPASNPTESLKNDEGFTRRTKGDDTNWQFQLNESRTSPDPIQTDFGGCFSGDQITAIGLNAWVQKIGVQVELNIFSEFGIFIEDEKGQRREYTLVVNEKDKRLYLRVRENENYTDYKQTIITPRFRGEFYPHSFYQYSAMIFLEINNQGLDIVYLGPGPGAIPSKPEDINPNQLTRIDEAVRPTLDKIQKIGLVGRGVNSQIILWPLTFYKK